jgi:WhiB family transcriptional regulator, redox-sensing transcriptional regulator
MARGSVRAESPFWYRGTRNDRSWTADAACQEADPDLFFPPKGRPDMTAEAIAWCGICPVRPQCLAEAMSTTPADDWGVRGGTTEYQRSEVRNKTARVKAEGGQLTG